MFSKLNKKLLFIFAAGSVFGILFWGGFHTVLEQTNTLEFCISCHEMEQTVYQEYKQSVHYKNASGVRATCPDCHVPRPWAAKLIRKIGASNELYHTLIGSIDTPQKFEDKRLELAEHVWATMKKTDSRECRNCHAFEYMDFHKQQNRAAEKMQRVVDDNTGETCIDCHKFIAHKKPVDYEDEDD